MKKKIISAMAAVLLSSAGISGALARSTPALLGAPSRGELATNFDVDPTLGSVVAARLPSPTTIGSWLVGLVIDSSGPKTVTVRVKRSGAEPAFARLVSNTAAGTDYRATRFQEIPRSDAYQLLTFSIDVPGSGVLLFRADLLNGSSVAGINYNP